MQPPPFERTSASVALLGEILRLVGRYEGLLRPTPQPQLRRQNRIKTVAATTAIEGNTLTLDQVSAVFDGKRVLGPKKDVLEVQNAIKAYADATSFLPDSVPSFLKAHKTLLKGLLPKPGTFRSEGVGIFKGSKVVHTAPPADRVEWLVKDLFAWSRKTKDEHPLIRAAVVHYELAFIHPFMDGNGRSARFWQHVALVHYAPVFEFVPMESVIQSRQADYYGSLAKSDEAGASTPFIEFSLQALHDALAQLLEEVRPLPLNAAGRLSQGREHFGSDLFSRKEYMALYKTLSSAQASRDLRSGVDEGTLVSEGRAAQTRYRFRA
jgi:Fic family protein